MERYQKSDNAYMKVVNTPQGDGVLADCDSTPTINIWDPSGKLLVNAASMEKLSTGIYFYWYLVPTTSDYGIYRWRVLLLNDTYTDQVDGVFEVL